MSKEKLVVYPNLLAEMGRNGETQADLATVLGISRPTVSRKISGQVDWTLKEIELLCERYGKDYYHLFIKKR